MAQRPGLADILEPGPEIEYGPTVAIGSEPLDGPTSIRAGAQLVTPLAFPLDPRPPEPGLVERMRRGAERTLAEVSEAWTSSGSLDATLRMARVGPFVVPVRLLFFVRRVRALLSFWDWQRDDLLRGAFIAGVVLTTVLGAASAARTSAGGSTEVRAPRTVDQHTGLAVIVRGKAAR